MIFNPPFLSDLSTVFMRLKSVFHIECFKAGNKLGGDYGEIVTLGAENLAFNGTQGEVGVSLFYFFGGGGGRLIFILSPHKRKLW